MPTPALTRVRKQTLAFLVLGHVLSLSAMAATQTPVNIKEGDRSYQGTLYLPDPANSPLPLVVVVHEWWGKTDYPDMRARKIADELGYAALAVDLYGDGKTAPTPK